MNYGYDEIVDFLVSELNVTAAQIKRSLSTTKVLKGIDLKNSIFKVNQDDPKDFMDQCAGKCPCKLFHLIITQGRKKREATIYVSKFWSHGYQKCSVTTSPKKERRCQKLYPERFSESHFSEDSE